MPEGEFKIERKAYQQFIQKCENGDMSYYRLENQNGSSSNVILFGANYNADFPLKNLYKALNLCKPDAIVLQGTSPDSTIQNELNQISNLVLPS